MHFLLLLFRNDVITAHDVVMTTLHLLPLKLPLLAQLLLPALALQQLNQGPQLVLHHVAVLTLLLGRVGGVESGDVVGVSTLPQLLLAGLVGEIGGRGDEDGDGDGELDILLNSSNCWDSLAERAAKSTLPFTSLPDSLTFSILNSFSPPSSSLSPSLLSLLLSQLRVPRSSEKISINNHLDD